MALWMKSALFGLCSGSAKELNWNKRIDDPDMNFLIEKSSVNIQSGNTNLQTTKLFGILMNMKFKF